MRKYNRWMLICLSAALLLLQSGCNPDAVNPTTEPMTSSTPQATNTDTVELSLWHIWATDSDSNKEPFEKAMSTWSEKNQNIQFNIEATENETYKVKLRVAIAVNEAPDIFYSWGAGFAKPFIDAGKVLPLNDRLTKDTLDKLQPGSLDNFTYGGQVYALPTFLIAGIFYVNVDLFDRYQIEVPETFDELLSAIKGFRKAGLTPIALGAKDGWPAIFYQNVLAIRTAGIEKCQAALKKEVSFDQPAFVESAELLKQLVDTGAFDEHSIQMTQYEADQQFLSGRVPMYYSGSWLTGIINKNEQMRSKVRAFNFPGVSGAAGDQNGFVGGTIDTFMISADTRFPDEAVKAISEISELFSRESYLAGAGLPAWQFEVDQSLASPLSNDILELLKERDGFVLAWDTMLQGLDARTHINLVTDIIAGRLSPEEFAREMQKLNE